MGTLFMGSHGLTLLILCRIPLPSRPDPPTHHTGALECSTHDALMDARHSSMPSTGRPHGRPGAPTSREHNSGTSVHPVVQISEHKSLAHQSNQNIFIYYFHVA